jgi:tetratricopeptide (TPR) repeat protein
VKRWIGTALVVLLISACEVPLRPDTGTSTPGSVEELAAAVAMDSRRSDAQTDSKTRQELASDASRDADACLQRAPQAVACLYAHALALGMQARAHPTQAGDLLKSMLEALSNAEAAAPEYDEAGPARVRALVLVRAPGWPLGPGDADAALMAARRAVALAPLYPPNLLAQAEALAKTGDTPGARESYQRARDLASALPPSADRVDWLRAAEQALRW